MTSVSEERLERGAPLPDVLQGVWCDPEDADYRVEFVGGEILWRGEPVDHDYKLLQRDGDALHVVLMMDDGDAIDRFDVFMPNFLYHGDDTMHAYDIVSTVNFFVRSDSGS